MRSLRLVIGICSAALLVPLLTPLATGRVFTLDDLGAYHLPMRYLYANALRNGESMLWTPAVFGGYYLFGEGQVGMAHPWHVLLYRSLPLNVAFNVEIVASYIALFAGRAAAQATSLRDGIALVWRDGVHIQRLHPVSSRARQSRRSGRARSMDSAAE
jgi:hypothetical protein